MEIAVTLWIIMFAFKLGQDRMRIYSTEHRSCRNYSSPNERLFGVFLLTDEKTDNKSAVIFVFDEPGCYEKEYFS